LLYFAYRDKKVVGVFVTCVFVRRFTGLLVTQGLQPEAHVAPLSLGMLHHNIRAKIPIQVVITAAKSCSCQKPSSPAGQTEGWLFKVIDSTRYTDCTTTSSGPF
jgi:hypothetical protein